MFYLFPLFSSLLIFILGFFIFLKNRKSFLNILFSFLCFSIFIWLFGTFLMFLNIENKNLAIFLDRICYIGVVFIPTFMYHFSVVFSRAKKQRFFVFTGYILSFIFMILAQTKYFVDDLFVYAWGAHSEARILHHFFILFFVFYLALFFINFYRQYKLATNNIEKKQAKYIFLTFFIFAFASVGFLPAYQIPVYPIFYLLGVIAASLIAYTIVQHRFLDIRIVVRQVTVYGFSLIVSIGLSILLMLLATKFLPFYISSFWIGSLILIFGIVIFQLVRSGFSRFANKHLFLSLYNYEKSLSDLTEKLSRTIDLKRLVFLTTETIKDVFKLDRIALILKKTELPQGQLRLLNNHREKTEAIKEKKEDDAFYLTKNTGFNKEKINPLIKNKLLIHYLESGKEPVIKDELERLIEESADDLLKKKMTSITDFMEGAGITLCLPLLIEDQMIGLFVLGKKISGDAYTVQDVSLLKTEARQITIAINNAQLYEQSQYFNQVMRVRIVEATRELGQAYRELKQLDDSKTEFLSLASHQLRTPLSAIKGYLSMVLEGSYGQIKPETSEALKSVYESNERLINLVNDLLNVTRIEAGKLEYNPVETDLNELINSVVNELKITAEKKNLLLQYSIKKLPKIFADPNKIRQVLINLIDNAIKYTPQGEVTVKTSIRNKKEVVVEVRDTGIGITPDKIKNLFEWFARGKGAMRLEAGGFGLGLYIAKKIIEKANGKIWAESKGKNKGTTFIFSLPL